VSGNKLFDLGTHNLKTGQSALLRFLWHSVENVWIQFLGAGLQVALELPQVSGTQQAVGEAWLIRPQLKLPHAIYYLIVWNLA
jgi:hypothetical protein